MMAFKFALSLALLFVATAYAVTCPQSCNQTHYPSAHWECCNFGQLDAPLCAGQDLCNDASQSHCCGISRHGSCNDVVRCFGDDLCLTTTCGNQEINPQCYDPLNNGVCERQENGCTDRFLYDTRFTICCGGNLFDNVNWECCNNVPFQVSSQECCNGVVVPKGQCAPPSSTPTHTRAPSASATRPPASASGTRPASASATRPPASASATRPPASASPTRPPATCSPAGCALSKGWTPPDGWSCCNFGAQFNLCPGEDLCFDAATSTCCGVTLNGNCYRVVRCYNGDSCTTDTCAHTATCYNPTFNRVCEKQEATCTARQLYDFRGTICCGGVLYDNVNWACCNNVPFQVSSQECCNGVVVAKGQCAPV